MADRRSLLSRFWPPSASRRPSTTQTAAAPPPSTTSKRSPQYQSSSPTSSPPPPRVETKTPVPTTPPRKASSSADSKEEPKTSSPSRLTTRSPSSSKPSSPSRFSSQSRSPPQPSSLPQSRSTFPSPSRAGSTPKWASKPPSPSHVTSPSPKGKDPASPSKDLMQPTEKISTSYDAPILDSKGNDPKLAASRQEAEVKKEVRPDRNNVAHGQTPEETSFKQDSVEAKPSQLLQESEESETNKSSKSSTVDGGEHEPRIKSEVKSGETREVKKVVQETKNEANEETKKEVNDSVTPESVSEAKILKEAENPSEAKQSHGRKQEATNTNEILSTPTPLRKSKNSGAHDKFALSNEEHVPLQKNIRDEMSKFTNKLAAGDHKKATSDSERAVSVITLAGENRGASMHMESDSSKREGPIPIHRSYKIKPDESSEATTDGEEIVQWKKSEDERSMEDQATEAYVNNNTQAINNSIVFNSSITEGSPGVHMVVSHLQKEPKDETNSSHETRRAEVNMSRAEKLTFQPTMRRRCLRGLLMETSDSDPEKPRPHGCRVSCKKEERENNVDEL